MKDEMNKISRLKQCEMFVKPVGFLLESILVIYLLKW